MTSDDLIERCPHGRYPQTGKTQHRAQVSIPGRNHQGEYPYQGQYPRQRRDSQEWNSYQEWDPY